MTNITQMRNLCGSWIRESAPRPSGWRAAIINFVVDERTGRIIMMGALDNLVKGAAGQAVQNMNLLFGLPESEGLELVPCFP